MLQHDILLVQQEFTHYIDEINIYFQKFCRYIHKGWDCKDDRKLLKYDDPKFELSIMHYM